MFGRTGFFCVCAAALVLCAACGDDVEVSGVAAPDAEGAETIADADASADATPTDAAVDIDAEVYVKPLGGQCEVCENKADCRDSFDCIALVGGSFCSSVCTTALDCSSKFTCDFAASTDTVKHCLPPNYSCQGCVVTGCPSDKTCDPVTGQCVVGKTPCTPCTKVSDCGPGLKCASLAGTQYSTQKLCMPDCSDGSPCPGGSVCQKTDAGNVCGFTGLACCYGNCQADPGCATCGGKCILGGCVDCLLDGDCPGGHCDADSHTCVNANGCALDTPLKRADGTCVQCLANTDCAVSQLCDVTKHACIEKPPACLLCADPTPDCAEVNGAWSCVQCVQNATCAAKKLGACASATLTCHGCQQDSDCVNSSGSALDLACDATSTGLCYDKSLKCDNISAFCNSPAGCTCQGGGEDLPGKCSCGF